MMPTCPVTDLVIKLAYWSDIWENEYSISLQGGDSKSLNSDKLKWPVAQENGIWNCGHVSKFQAVYQQQRLQISEDMKLYILNHLSKLKFYFENYFFGV